MQLGNIGWLLVATCLAAQPTIIAGALAAGALPRAAKPDRQDLLRSLRSASWDHVAGLAQEGHPLVGTWYGDWGPSSSERNDVTVVMSWDGKSIGGLINPGPNAIPFKVATLDSSKWTVHIEAEARDKAGNVVRDIVDGKLENIGSYNRTLTGTWTRGSVKGDFKLTRE
jgi:hypothetical protein